MLNKILINTSNLKATGVVQVASSFINECASIKGYEYIVFLSPQVKKNISIKAFPENFIFYEFGKDSLYSWRGRNDLKRMKEIERKEKPDVVFSVFGPSLWKPKAPHLMGFAYPYYVYHDSPLYSLLTIKEKIKEKIKELVHIYLLKNEGEYYVCETDDVANRLSAIHKIKRENIYRVYNTASSVFLNYKHKLTLRTDDEFRFFTLCSPYKHKNLSILNDVIPLLRNINLSKQIKFYTTFTEEVYLSSFKESVRDMIVNVGPLLIKECPDLVEKCDALFLPTLLECYSASYPEAMCMRKPIITSNLPFAETVCKDAAIYFNPLDVNSIVSTIVNIVENPSIQKELVSKGIKRLMEFGTAHDRALEYLKICEQISKV